MYKITTMAATAALSMAMVTASVPTLAADSSEPIVIPTHNWSSQIVMAHVIGQIFEGIGDTVDYVPSDSQAVYEAIRQGDVTISHEVWESTFGESFNTALEKGGILDAGTHEAATREEWWYPAYVADLCPGLPDWTALDDCAAMFTTPDSGGKGRYLDGPQDWHGQETLDRIDALGMNFVAKFAGSASALWAELESANAEGRATVVFNWSPNFTDAVYGGDFVKFPEWTAGCKKSEGGDGKCGSPPAGWLKKAAHDLMPVKWPHAYEAFTKISFTAAQIGAMAAMVDIDGLSAEDAASKWIADNADLVASWTN